MNNYYTIVFTGESFTGTVAQTTVTVDGKAQLVTSVSSTQIVARIIYLADQRTTNYELFTITGSPQTSADFVKKELFFDPVLVGFNINQGSEAGSVITATIRGLALGTDSTAIKLQYGAAKTQLCAAGTL